MFLKNLRISSNIFKATIKNSRNSRWTNLKRKMKTNKHAANAILTGGTWFTNWEGVFVHTSSCKLCILLWCLDNLNIYLFQVSHVVEHAFVQFNWSTIYVRPDNTDIVMIHTQPLKSVLAVVVFFVIERIPAIALVLEKR